MGSKKNYSDESPSPSARYQSFIAQNLEYLNPCLIKELQGRKIRACFHGWIILSNNPDNVLWSLWNPFTSKLIRLPPLIHKETVPHECCLSSPPTDQASVFLLFSDRNPTIDFCRLDCNQKRFKWTKMSYAKQLTRICEEDDCLLQCPAYCNGKVYGVTFGRTHTSKIVHVDIAVRGKDVVITLLPCAQVPVNSYYRSPSNNRFITRCSLLKGSCKELFYIELCYEDETRRTLSNVFLFKLDVTSMVWERMLDLKDAIIFLEFGGDCSYSVFYQSAVGSEISGYVQILGASDKTMHSFHVEDRTISISSTPCIVRVSQGFVWAMLECRFEAECEQKEEGKQFQIALRRVKHDSDSESHSHLLNLPFHILETIMEHCIGVEYLKFRATCKRCSLAAPLIQRGDNRVMSRRLQAYSLASPWFLVLDNYRGVITFIDPVYGDRYFIKKPLELDGDYQICCSRYGWLLMHTMNGPLVFFNPFTSDIRKLPGSLNLDSVCFSAPPTSPDCIVVGFATLFWHVYVYSVSQEPSWRRYHLNFGTNDPYPFHFPVFSDQDIYALCNNERIEAFRDVNNVVFSWELVKDKAPISCCKSPPRYFLSKCDKRLVLVIVGEFGESVEVFRLNDPIEEWEKVDSLRKHMIYISNTSCICLEAKLPEMENKIYFPRLNKGKMVFYSLDTRRYHVFTDDKMIEASFGACLFGTELHCFPHTWIEPSWS